MRFGVLGPLAVWTDEGTAVRIPELKVRALLADLLAHRGRPVSVDQLVDDLWGASTLPRNPVGTLQTRVSQLRRALAAAEPGGRGLVVSQAPGYLLRAEPETVDGARFHALAARARATEDPHVRAVLLADALALWRGRAYADFADEEFVRPEVLRLEDERLAVREEHAETRLELGEHAVLAGELGDLVARHPLRERLRAVQLRALYRAGRQGEALAGYEDLRRRLAEELGVDPGPELVALHRAILEQDPGLDAPRTMGHAVRASPPPAARTNLPAPLTELVGRADAVRQVRALLDESRLVTLTGPGGVGKTRLALETARTLADADAGERFADGVRLVELAGLDGASGASPADAIAMVLGVRDDDAPAAPSGRRTPVELLADALAGKRLLLVLDNCEHVVDQVAVQVAALLRAAPGLRVLATSQESLALSGERLWAVPPLDEADAVRLFTARAAAAAPGFEPGPGDAATIAAICRRLDGIPLAVELAATRVRALGVAELADRLDDRFRLLVSGSRDAPARQRTLRAMIDWSWEPLTGAERAVLRRLAVHADGCTLEAAEEVCAADGLDVLDVLARLVDRSLVVRVEGAGRGVRYRLLESVRAYCLERLDEAGESAAIRARHVRYHAALAVRAEPHLYGRDQRRWLELLDGEAANQRAALEEAARAGLAAEALGLVNALAWHWYLRGRLTEAMRSLDLALAVAGGPPEERARATVWADGFALLTDPGTEAPAAPGPAPHEDLKDPSACAWARWFLAFSQRGFGDLEVTSELLECALEEFRGLGERWGTAAALGVRATVHRARGRLAEAGRDAAESEALFREIGDRWGQLKATNTLGELAEIAGDYDRAARLHEEGLRMAEELGFWAEASLRLSGLGRISLLTGDHATADDRHRRALRLAADQSNKVAEHFAAVGLALSARRQGDLDEAEARLLPWVDWIRTVDGEPGLALVLAELGFAAELRGDADAALVRHRDGLAAARRIGDPRAVALAFEGIAGARSLAGDARPAARLLGAAAALRRSVGAPLPGAERGDVDRITGRVRTLLDDAAFAAEFARGGDEADAVAP